jgi:hypothetical protein
MAAASSAAEPAGQYLAAAKSMHMHVTVAGMTNFPVGIKQPAGDLFSFQCHLDSGCGVSIGSKAYARKMWHRLCPPGSSARLMRLATPVSVGLFAGNGCTLATHVLQGVQLYIGKGVYTVDFLLIEDGNFNLVLGNSFMVDFAAKLFTRDPSDRHSGRFLVLPLCEKMCQPGVREPLPPPHRGKHWYPSQMVPVSYDLSVDTWFVVPETGGL